MDLDGFGKRQNNSCSSAGPVGYAKSLGKLNSVLVRPVMCKGTEWVWQKALISSYKEFNAVTKSPESVQP